MSGPGTPRRVARAAALYDAHGNLPALEAVLAEPDVEQADLVVLGGDVVLGPMPRETLERLTVLGDRALFIRGNTDRALSEGAPASVEDFWLERQRWTAEQLDAEQLDLLAGLPLTEAVEIDGLGPTLFCHATPRNDDEVVTRETPTERLSSILAGVRERVVVCGHTHVQFDRVVDGFRLVNAGSVGMPYEGEPGAYWALLGPDVELRRTPYDVDAAAERIRASGLPGAAEFAEEYVLTSYAADEATATFERMAAEAGDRGG